MSRPKRDYTVQMYEDSFYLDKFVKHECCHCALVHDTEYKVENGRIFTRWKVNEKETKEQRKKFGIKISRKSGDA
jgi:hypothetical protein